MIGCHYTADIKSRSGAALNDLQLLFHSVSTFSKLFSKKKIKKIKYEIFLTQNSFLDFLSSQLLY